MKIVSKKKLDQDAVDKINWRLKELSSTMKFRTAKRKVEKEFGIKLKED